MSDNEHDSAHKTALFVSGLPAGTPSARQRRMIRRIVKWAKNGDNIDARITYFSQTALHMAILKGLDDIAELLIDLHCNLHIVDWIGACPLHYAAQAGNLRIVKRLVRSGANVFARELQTNSTPSHHAIANGHAHVLTYLFTQGVLRLDVQRSLFDAGRIEEPVLQVMIDAGCDVTKPSTGNECPLHKIAPYGTDQCIYMLVDAGADIDAVNIRGYSPLMIAAAAANESATKALIVAGADIYLQNCFRETALHLAVFCCSNNASLQWLLAAEAMCEETRDDDEQPTMLDMPNYQQRRLLDIAIQYRNLDQIRWLIAAGASYEHVDFNALHTETRAFFAALHSGAEWQNIAHLSEQIGKKCSEISHLVYRHVSDRASLLCIALQSLNLPALVTLTIVDVLYDPSERLSMHAKWKLIAMVKHFLPN